jgi:hypothetical protein
MSQFLPTIDARACSRGALSSTGAARARTFAEQSGSLIDLRALARGFSCLAPLAIAHLWTHDTAMLRAGLVAVPLFIVADQLFGAAVPFATRYGARLRTLSAFGFICRLYESLQQTCGRFDFGARCRTEGAR